MQLNRKNLFEISTKLDQERLLYPKPSSRILQFGTGVLLRALPIYCIEKANRSGIFNGGVLLIKFTQTGSIASFIEQDGLFTLRTAGVQNNKETTSQEIITCVNDTLDANSSWPSILAVAQDKDINIIISNTNEKGIVDVGDDIFASPPASYPGKLTSYLYA